MRSYYRAYVGDYFGLDTVLFFNERGKVFCITAAVAV